MNAPDTEGVSFASRFWESTRRLCNSTLCFISSLFSCKGGEARSDTSRSKPKNTSKSIKAVVIRQPRKSIRSLDGVKVIKSYPLAHKSSSNYERTNDTTVKSVPERLATTKIGSKILETNKSIELKSIPKPDSAEVRKIKRSNSNRSIGLVFAVKKKFSSKIGSDGKIQAPGVPSISRGPDGRVIRLSFMTGFPKRKSPKAQPESDDLQMAKRLRTSKEVHPENGSMQADLLEFELDSRDTITKDEIRGTSSGIKSLLVAGIKDDPEGLAIGRKSSQSITSITSVDIERKNEHH